jgi:hypothetical protein
LKIFFNIVLPSMPLFFKLSLSVFPPNVCMQNSPTCSTCTAYLILLGMIIQIIFAIISVMSKLLSAHS